MKIARLRKVGSNIGREGMSLLAQGYINDYDGSYKGVMELCGKLSVIAKMSTCDQYWNEQVCRGENKVNEICEFKLEQMDYK